MDVKEAVESKGIKLLGHYVDTVLCDTGQGFHPFVTWEVSSNGSLYSGHYFKNLEEAKKDFENRIK
tara:strand:+ start:694 stop:891 length:198 start_codon:yes stop_codon:yes gene_type:complete